jgi:hypothetical protein
MIATPTLVLLINPYDERLPLRVAGLQQERTENIDGEDAPLVAFSRSSLSPIESHSRYSKNAGKVGPY